MTAFLWNSGFEQKWKVKWSEQIIFRLSGLHSSIGNVQGWALDPSFMDMRLKRPPAKDGEGGWKNYRWDLVSPKESVYGIALISAFASAESPTLAQNWEHLFELSAAFNNKIPRSYEQLREDLANLEIEITERNIKRAGDDEDLNGVFPCVDFLPSMCELSIAG